MSVYIIGDITIPLFRFHTIWAKVVTFTWACSSAMFVVLDSLTPLHSFVTGNSFALGPVAQLCPWSRFASPLHSLATALYFAGGL